MRTTLDIDNDVLQAAKELAAARRLTAGRAISDLARAVESRVSVSRLPELSVRLGRFCRDQHHKFWSDIVSLRDATVFDAVLIRGHRQVTDVYLLGLTKQHNGCLATFDRTIPVKAVTGTDSRTLTVITVD